MPNIMHHKSLFGMPLHRFGPPKIKPDRTHLPVTLKACDDRRLTPEQIMQWSNRITDAWYEKNGYLLFNRTPRIDAAQYLNREHCTGERL